MSSSIDLLTPWLISIASVIISVTVPILMTWLSKHLSLSQNALLNSMLSAAVSRGAGAAQNYMANSFRSNPADAYKDGLKVGAQYVLSSFPDTIKSLGVSPEKITAMVEAEIGRDSAIITNPAVLG